MYKDRTENKWKNSLRKMLKDLQKDRISTEKYHMKS